MTASRTFQTAAAVLILGVAAISGRAQGQAYYYSGADNGQADVGLTPGNTPGGNLYTGYFDVYFGPVSETLYYNPVAQTLSTAGTVTLGPSSGTFNMVEVGNNDVVGSATLTVGNNGTISLDDTYTHLGGNTFDGDLVIPVSAVGTYDGQAFTGSWDEVLPLAINITADSPTSLTFTQGADLFGGPAEQALTFGQTVISGLGLTDGAEIQDAIWYQWDVDPVADGVPDEGSSLLLLGLGISLLGFLRRRFPSPSPQSGPA